MCVCEGRGCVRALPFVLLDVIVAFVLSAAITFVNILTEPSAYVIEHIPGIIPPGLYFLVAFSAGIAGAFAFVKEHLSSSISGVAVSASLVPPLCAIGIGVALRDISLAERSLYIFLLNFGCIVLAALLVFWILGFR